MEVFANRFGFGLRVDQQYPKSNYTWLNDQLHNNENIPNLLNKEDIYNIFHEDYDKKDKEAIKKHARKINNIIRQTEISVLSHCIMSEYSFNNKLMLFWYNFFTVSTRQNNTAPFIGEYLQTAIRDNMQGKFSDLLNAVIRNQAMLRYLDNINSIGPDSRKALSYKKKGIDKGLNENLARECLELYTITPKSGYSQKDVTSFANILTGAGVDKNGNFHFYAENHEPGEWGIMNHKFTEGEDGFNQALLWLGTHHMTYRHIASKLLTYFISDNPKDYDVRNITNILIHNGSLKQVYIALAEIRYEKKYRNPLDYAISVCRNLTLDGSYIDIEDKNFSKTIFPKIFHFLNKTGMPLFSAGMPNGWSSQSSDWISPEGTIDRIDWSYQMSGLCNVDIEDVLFFSGCQKDNVILSFKNAPSRKDALTILLNNPDYVYGE